MIIAKIIVAIILTYYDEKSPSFREGMNHHPYYFLQK